MLPPRSESSDDLELSELRRFVATLASQVERLQVQVGATGEMVELKDAEIAALKIELTALKDEIARLKGLPPRPKFKGKPSGMEKATSPGAGGKGRSKRGRGSKRDRLEAARVVVMKVAVPPGSRFLGYEDSDAGKAARDTMLGLLKTCRKLNVSFYLLRVPRRSLRRSRRAPRAPAPGPRQVRLSLDCTAICPGCGLDVRGA